MTQFSGSPTASHEAKTGALGGATLADGSALSLAVALALAAGTPALGLDATSEGSEPRGAGEIEPDVEEEHAASIPRPTRTTPWCMLHG
jgi:hypothetical protein